MNLKNGILFDPKFDSAFLKLIKQPFPATVSLQLVETLQKLTSQQTNVFKVRNDLMTRLVSNIENGIPNFKSKENELEFSNEINDLLKIEFEIPLKDKVILTEKLTLSGEDIIALKPILAVEF